MTDTYAVVTKPEHPRPPSPVPAYSNVATPISNSANRTPPSSHHYDNDPAGAPIYSTVRPRGKHSATPLYDTAAPSNHKLEEGLPPLNNSGEYRLMPAEPADDDDYEDFSSSTTDRLCSPGGIGFNCRIQRPRGPRDPPADWSRLDK